MATISKENYLKAIYGLALDISETVSASDLSKELNVSNSAITEMANKLSKQGYIQYEKYKGIRILEKGRKLAIDVIRKHRIWEIFLIDTLGYNWDEVHIEAEKLEHCSSTLLIDRIDKYLDYPSIDPHGEPVPNKDGTYRTFVDDIPMKNCQIGNKYLISRVDDKNPDLVKYLSQINMELNKVVIIIDKLSFDGSIIISVDNVNHSLSEKLVDKIYLSEIQK